ncbi:hypothetical protein [Nocardioides speluncae]|uniref:hypothetical protein n=1 Tax=Nocardioides speluncae TaxID=2670337 RepID=UPI000D68AF53|nr:hypothetical protein [Nocardioides speluncae]
MTRAPLDSFESALLSELRDTVAERSATRSQSRRRRPILVAAAAATAVAASVGAVVFGLGTGGPAPAAAYSVAAQDDGDIVVTIRRLDDAEGLERALAEHGITADVDYGGPVSNCIVVPDDGDPGPCDEVEELPEGDGGLSGGGQMESEAEPAVPTTEALPADPGDFDDPCGFGENSPASLSRSGSDWVITIPADSPLHDGVDLHLMTQGGDDEAALTTVFSKGDTGCGSSELVN